MVFVKFGNMLTDSANNLTALVPVQKTADVFREKSQNVHSVHWKDIKHVSVHRLSTSNPPATFLERGQVTGGPGMGLIE